MFSITFVLMMYGQIYIRSLNFYYFCLITISYVYPEINSRDEKVAY